MKDVEFFGVHNFRCAKKCCRLCKYIKEFWDNNPNYSQPRTYFYCSHPDIDGLQYSYPTPILQFNVCDAFEPMDPQSI